MSETMKIIENMLSEVNGECDTLEHELNELNGIVEEKRRHLETLYKASEGLRASLELYSPAPGGRDKLQRNV